MTTDSWLSLLACLLALSVILQTVHLLLSSAHHGRLVRELRTMERKQAERHAWQVRLQREAKASERLVTDPLAWLAAQANAGLPDGKLGKVDSPRVDQQLRAVEVIAEDGRRLVVAPCDAQALCALERRRIAGLSVLQRASLDYEPMLSGVNHVRSHRRGPDNAGEYFDLAAAQAGRLLELEGWGDPPELWFHVHGNERVREPLDGELAPV